MPLTRQQLIDAHASKLIADYEAFRLISDEPNFAQRFWDGYAFQYTRPVIAQLLRQIGVVKPGKTLSALRHQFEELHVAPHRSQEDPMSNLTPSAATRSGKPIYPPIMVNYDGFYGELHPDVAGYTEADHRDALEYHMGKYHSMPDRDEGQPHWDAAAAHHEAIHGDTRLLGHDPDPWNPLGV